VGKEAGDELDAQTNSESSLEYVKMYSSSEGIESLPHFSCINNIYEAKISYF
jgi:hypothetical protein